MRCPSWSRLVAHRYAGPDEPEPAGWRAALEHLESCAACRKAAYAADPTLVLRGQGTAQLDGEEVSRMRAGVDALRRARHVEERSPAAFGQRGLRPHRRGHDGSTWSRLAPSATRLAAAAGLAAVLLSTHPPVAQEGIDPSPATTASGEIEALVLAPELESWGSDLAATDDFYRSTATVYQFDEVDLDLVILVDSELDV